MKDKTAYGYMSYFKIFLDWINTNVRNIKYCYQIDRFLISDFFGAHIDRQGKLCQYTKQLPHLVTCILLLDGRIINAHAFVCAFQCPPRYTSKVKQVIFTHYLIAIC